MTKKNRWIVAAATFTVVSLLAITGAAGMTITQRAQLGTLSQLDTLVQASAVSSRTPKSHVLPPVPVAPALSPAPVQETVDTATVPSEVAAAIAVMPPPPPPPIVSVAVAQRGEGVIAIVKRTCGHTLGWQKVAAANNIFAPVYKVLNQQKLTVDCSLRGTVAPPPAPVAAPAPVNGAAWQHPLPGRCVSSGFGWRGGRIHNGVDLMTSVGTDVRAAAAGKVHYGDDPDGAGWYITLDHGNGLWTTYYHLSNRVVGAGSWVSAGQHIAESGGAKGAPGAGNSSGPHLHFEVHPWGQWSKRWSDSLDANAYTDPIRFMQDRGVGLSWC